MTVQTLQNSLDGLYCLIQYHIVDFCDNKSLKELRQVSKKWKTIVDKFPENYLNALVQTCSRLNIKGHPRLKVPSNPRMQKKIQVLFNSAWLREFNKKSLQEKIQAIKDRLGSPPSITSKTPLFKTLIIYTPISKQDCELSYAEEYNALLKLINFVQLNIDL